MALIVHHVALDMITHIKPLIDRSRLYLRIVAACGL